MVPPPPPYRYGWVLDDPLRLEIPTSAPVAPLPSLTEPAELPRVPVPAPGDAEPMVSVVAPRIRVLSAYFHSGHPAAPGAFLRSGAAERLVAAASTLPDGFGLAVCDAWRSLEVQNALYAQALADPGLPPGFVAPPSTDPSTPPAHLTGGTVDVTLTFENRPLALGTGFDEFVDAAYTASFEHIPGTVRYLRRLLYWTMRSSGFVVLDQEWWHFEYGTRRWAALTGRPVRYGAADLVLAPERFTDTFRFARRSS